MESRVRASPEISAAEWIAARLPGKYGLFSSFLPAGFEKYARIFHPAVGPWEKRASWSEVAAWSGKVMDADAEFELLERRTAGEGAGRTHGYEPRFGELLPDLVDTLAEVLGSYTRSPERCWFCVWEGGWIKGPGTLHVALGTAERERVQIQSQWEAGWELSFGREALAFPRVQFPAREYVLLEGPLDAVAEIGERTHFQGRSHFESHSPNLWWPDDQAWCVATEIDHQSTYVGGPEGLISELLIDARFEAFESIAPA